jgi:hypothetical protein
VTRALRQVLLAAAMTVLASGTSAQTDGSLATPPPGEVAVQADDGPPDPSTWILDSEGRHTSWLNLPLIDGADLADRPGEYADVLASHGVLMDLDSPLLALRGATLHDVQSIGYPVEYLVVTERGRTYEAAILVRAMPSVVDACLQAMGLEPGSSTSFALRDPPPTDAELEAGTSAWIMTSAGGPLLGIEVQWTDGDGLPHTASLESLLLELPMDGSEPKPLEELGWVYCGGGFGRYRQGRDMVKWHRGDVEGDVAAIYLDGRQACLLERNSLDGVDGSLYTLNPETMPPPQTPVTLMLRPLEGQRAVAREISLDRTPDAAAGDPGGG